MLTMLDDDETVLAAMRAGAQGYLLKGAGQDELERALRGVVAGEAIFGPGVAARMLQHFAGGGSGPFPQLTDREQGIIRFFFFFFFFFFGTGITSMRERAALVGGTLVAGNGDS